jgi:hypothetical protein
MTPAERRVQEQRARDLQDWLDSGHARDEAANKELFDAQMGGFLIRPGQVSRPDPKPKGK